jgi:hypothetical protein
MEGLGVFIIWQSGEEYIDDIIVDLQKKFKILYAKSLFWDFEDVCINLNKLYPHRKFESNSPKVKEIGQNKEGVRLHIFIVVDDKIQMKNDINLNFQELKNSYRKKYRTNFIHSADNHIEAVDNIKKVLELDYVKILKREEKYIVFDKKSFKILESKKIKFNDIREVFELLNKNKIEYVVLRNWDDFDGNILSEEHSDIDLLVMDYFKVISLLNAKKMKKEHYRVQHSVSINNLEIPFDLRYIGDDYYDKKWQIEIVKKRKKFKYFFIPDEVNYYYSLLYHALIQKPFLSHDYRKKLKKINSDKLPSIGRLKMFMRKNNYSFTRPLDRSVYYRFSLLHYRYMFTYFLKKNIYLKSFFEWVRK